MYGRTVYSSLLPFDTLANFGVGFRIRSTSARRNPGGLRGPVTPCSPAFRWRLLGAPVAPGCSSLPRAALRPSRRSWTSVLRSKPRVFRIRAHPQKPGYSGPSVSHWLYDHLSTAIARPATATSRSDRPAVADVARSSSSLSARRPSQIPLSPPSCSRVPTRSSPSRTRRYCTRQKLVRSVRARPTLAVSVAVASSGRGRG